MLMHPKDFMERWGLSRGELASLLGKKMVTVNHWFSTASNLDPPVEVLKRLDEMHVRFSQWELEDEHLSNVRTIYELIRERRSQD